MNANNGMYTKYHANGHTNGTSTIDDGQTLNPVAGSEQMMPVSRDEHPQPVSPEVEPGEESYDAHFEELVRQMITRLGETPERDGLKRTPLRVAKAMDFLTSGYTTDLDKVVNGAIFEDDGQEVVLVKDIEFYSLCEHHMLPFFGRVHIAYIPNGKIIGLSKLARVADVFARRLQVQERLTNQIADALNEILTPRGVAVVAEAAHFCMMMRGVQKQNSSTLTSAMRGVFKDDPQQRDQFMRLIGK